MMSMLEPCSLWSCQAMMQNVYICSPRAVISNHSFIVPQMAHSHTVSAVKDIRNLLNSAAITENADIFIKTFNIVLLLMRLPKSFCNALWARSVHQQSMLEIHFFLDFCHFSCVNMPHSQNLPRSRMLANRKMRLVNVIIALCVTFSC